MKTQFFLINWLLILFCIVPNVDAQDSLKSHGNIPSKLLLENAFLDASEFTFSRPDSIARGLYFPPTDLTNWEFVTNKLNGTDFPTAFHGMIVYNKETGSTLTGQGVVVSVKPGFYFFNNPNETTDITNGSWTRMFTNDDDTYLDSMVLLQDSLLAYYVAGKPFDTLLIKAYNIDTTIGDEDFKVMGTNNYPTSITDVIWSHGSLSFGNSTGVDNAGSFASGKYSLAGGTNSYARSPNSIAMGTNSIADGDNACFAIGNNARVIKHASVDSTVASFAFGRNTTASGVGSVASGDSCIAIGLANFASGIKCEARGKKASFAMGEKAKVTGSNSFAFGHGIIVEGNNSVGFAIADLSDGSTVVTQDSTIAIIGGRVGVQVTSMPTDTLSVQGGASKDTGAKWICASDERAKENINNYSKGLNYLLQLQPISFNYIPEMGYGHKTQVGFIAQEVEKILPSIVETIPEYNYQIINKMTDSEKITEVNTPPKTKTIKNFKKLNNSEITYLLINSVKELNTEKTVQKSKFEELEVQQKQLKLRMEKIDALMKQEKLSNK